MSVRTRVLLDPHNLLKNSHNKKAEQEDIRAHTHASMRGLLGRAHAPPRLPPIRSQHV